ncbi:transporter substrate-binding domain-containing protein [Brevibacillus sp. BC25]|uniref:transporter substrate-binding domain-containing protein n=1 Tax=Brevibacillus sp. BC25 TaxID=1144308 RepID=UPI000271298C|nr:transporter substrate-binding domain-containing protein [Brevibacillus sp. BC25]EJL23307.1 histidine kinase,extracellular solute-binding protein, family 3 [Brevibacillus sp. BC25]
MIGGKKIGIGLMLGVILLLTIGMTIPSEVHQEKVIRIAGDNNFPPFEYFAQTGVFSGFNVDIINAISIETGMRIEFVPLPWNVALDALRNGHVDAVQGMKYSPARDKLYDFSAPYFLSSQGIFVRTDNVHIFGIGDLTGRRVAIQKADIAADLFLELQNTSFIETDSQEEAVQLLLDGKVDAFVGNRITGQYFLQKNNQQSQIKIVGDPIDPTDYGVAVLPKNVQLLTEINKAISKIKQNGTYDKIERKWFGQYIRPNTPNLERLRLYLEWGSGIGLLIVLGILWWNRMLKKEVQRRTSQIHEINRELKEKMALLEENLQFQQQLLNSTYSFYVTLTQHGRIFLMNRKAVDFLDVDHRLTGLPLSGTILAEFIPNNQVEDVLMQGSTYLEQEIVWERERDGQAQRLVIRYNIFPIISPAKEITGAIINFHDVTKQKDMEKKLESENRLRSLGQLILGIAHEIRNPLTSILTYTQLLPTKFDNPKFRNFFAQQVPGEILRLNDLVNDLLEYARPKPPHPARFRVADLMEAVLQLCSQKIKEKKVQVSLSLPPHLCIEADVNQTKQIWINVVLNAIESMDAQGKLNIRGYTEGQMVVVEVEDNGHGMSPEDKYRIFEPFFSTKANGVGLGLSITYQLIKENGGAIDLHSQPGHGTTMIIRLPMPQQETEGKDSYAPSVSH